MANEKLSLYLYDNEDTILAKNCIRDTLRVVNCPYVVGCDDSGDLLFFFSVNEMSKINTSLRDFLIEGLKDSWTSNTFHVIECKEILASVYEHIDYDAMLFRLRRS